MSSFKAARRAVQIGLVAAAFGATATAPALAAAPAPAPAPAPGSSAFGLTATGPVALPPLPVAQSLSDTVSRSLLRENLKVVDAGVLNVKAAKGYAHSDVATLKVPTAGLFAQAVSATCRDGRGVSHVANAVVAGKHLDVSPPPNTTVPFHVDGLGDGSVVINKQERLGDGRLRVTALAVRVPLGGGKAQTILVSSATCGKLPAKPVTPPHSAAPKPHPVRGDLPVTG
ncbi:choice-of-anchor P family protein [Actinomadura atramentaria]|uniref:choice-of-anchor P family protein n=1 Tax=Actinomadura atramentaria TaxID=1990 RepID=UPI0003638A05|nr:choice-of-anchor P family protein [Actinomadura atramentaria]